MEKSTDWTTARFEAIATLAMNGLLANSENNNASAEAIAKRAVEMASALDYQLSLTPAPVGQPPAQV